MYPKVKSLDYLCLPPRKAVKRLCLNYFKTAEAGKHPNRMISRNLFVKAISTSVKR